MKKGDEPLPLTGSAFYEVDLPTDGQHLSASYGSEAAFRRPPEDVLERRELTLLKLVEMGELPPSVLLDESPDVHYRRHTLSGE